MRRCILAKIEVWRKCLIGRDEQGHILRRRGWIRCLWSLIFQRLTWITSLTWQRTRLFSSFLGPCQCLSKLREAPSRREASACPCVCMFRWPQMLLVSLLLSVTFYFRIAISNLLADPDKNPDKKLFLLTSWRCQKRHTSEPLHTLYQKSTPAPLLSTICTHLLPALDYWVTTKQCRYSSYSTIRMEPRPCRTSPTARHCPLLIPKPHQNTNPILWYYAKHMAIGPELSSLRQAHFTSGFTSYLLYCINCINAIWSREHVTSPQFLWPLKVN